MRLAISDRDYLTHQQSFLYPPPPSLPSFFFFYASNILKRAPWVTQHISPTERDWGTPSGDFFFFFSYRNSTGKRHPSLWSCSPDANLCNLLHTTPTTVVPSQLHATPNWILHITFLIPPWFARNPLRSYVTLFGSFSIFCSSYFLLVRL